mmetsp:Transcript_105254/g.303656  ORF Transcript_105254/g.303656 Transcript_105254/m.303656 type:complete len:292 (-) Transcript_105254:570-1445(-)
MGLVALYQAGYLKFLCTQNIENLHRLSGFPSDSLWEAHGNLCLAVCPSCNQTFLPPPKSKLCTECHDPSTGARPTRRTGMLRRRVLSHYGAKVEVPAMVQEQVKQADLSLIIGTSLSVQPFARFASSAPTLAIVNLERTRMHDAEERAKAEGARIACESDKAMDALLLLLGIIPYAANPNPNLPAFLEVGEQNLDVAAIFLGGRRAYNKPTGTANLPPPPPTPLETWQEAQIHASGESFMCPRPTKYVITSAPCYHLTSIYNHQCQTHIRRRSTRRAHRRSLGGSLPRMIS